MSGRLAALIGMTLLLAGCALPLHGGRMAAPPEPSPDPARLLLDLERAALDEGLLDTIGLLQSAIADPANAPERSELIRAREELLADLLLLPDTRDSLVRAALSRLLDDDSLPDHPSARAAAALTTGIHDPSARATLRILSVGPASLFDERTDAALADLPRVRLAVLRHAIAHLDAPAGQQPCPGALLSLVDRVDRTRAATLCACTPADCAARLQRVASAAAPRGDDLWAHADVYWLDAVDALRRDLLRHAAAGARAARWQEEHLSAAAVGLVDRRIEEPVPPSTWNEDPRIVPPELPPLAFAAPEDAVRRDRSPRVLLVRSDGLALTLRPVVSFDPEAATAPQRWRLADEQGPWQLPGRDILTFAGLSAPLAGHLADGLLPTLHDALVELDNALPENLARDRSVAILADGDALALTLAAIVRTARHAGLEHIEWLMVDPADGRTRALAVEIAESPPEDATRVVVESLGVRVVPPGEAPSATAGPPRIGWADPMLFHHIADGIAAARQVRPGPVAVVVDDALAEWALVLKVLISAGWNWPHDVAAHPWHVEDGRWPSARSNASPILVLPP